MSVTRQCNKNNQYECDLPDNDDIESVDITDYTEFRERILVIKGLLFDFVGGHLGGNIELL